MKLKTILMAIAASVVFSANARAQEADGVASVEFIGGGIDVAVNADIDVGVLMPPAAPAGVDVRLICNNGLPQTTPANIVIMAGACGEVVVSTASSSDITFRVSATGNIGEFANAEVNVFAATGGRTIRSTDNHTVNDGSDETFYLGLDLGTVLPTQAAGVFTGTYTFTATVQ